MKFLLDAQLPPSFAQWFTSKGYEASHVVSHGLGGATDADIADFAEKNGWILISKDEDFRNIRLPARFPLLWLRCGNCTNRALGAFMDERWDQIAALLNEGEDMIEIK